MLDTVVKVYTDPLNQLNFEGMARVIKKETEDHLFYYCWVCFLFDDMTVFRKILK